jgi:hypothetical protein
MTTQLTQKSAQAVVNKGFYMRLGVELRFNGAIVSFNLTLSDQSGTATLIDGVNGGTVFIGPGGLSATPTELLFNFGASGSFVNFFTSPGCEPIWTLRGSGGTACNGISGPVNAVQVSSTSVAASVPGVGILPIGVIPEPGTVGLMVAGLVSLIGLRKLVSDYR